MWRGGLVGGPARCTCAPRSPRRVLHRPDFGLGDEDDASDALPGEKGCGRQAPVRGSTAKDLNAGAPAPRGLKLQLNLPVTRLEQRVLQRGRPHAAARPFRVED